MDGKTDQRLLENLHDQPTVRIGEVVRSRIIEIKRHGARVRLPNGEDAWLPAKEWFSEIRPHESLVDLAFHHKSDTIDVIVYDEAPRGHRREKLVSFTRVEVDPWDAVLAWPDNIVKVMEVELVTGTRALGDIDPGIRGQVLLETLKELFTPEWRHHAPIRPGDKVAGFVTRQAIDPQKRIVTLDVAGFIKSEVRVDKLLTSGASPAPHPSQRDESPFVGGYVRQNITTALKRLLVVDDAPEFLKEVPDYLQGFGCEIIRCSSAGELREWLEHDNEPVDLALIDLHFADRRYEGLHVAADLQAEQPGVPIIIVTADDTIYTDTSFVASEGAMELKVCGVVLKPFGFEGFLRALADSNRERRRLLDVLTGGGPSRPHRLQRRESWRQELHEVLDALAGDVSAGAVVLFSLHPVSMEVQIVSRGGAAHLVQSVQPNIERSPIRDVAIDEDEVIAADAADPCHYPQHRWLQRAYRYRSCIAVPVHCASEFAYGLFALDTQRKRFSELQFPRMRRAADELAHVLYAHRVEGRLSNVEPYELLGRAYGSMSHDLRHLLDNESTTKRLLRLVRGKTELAGKELDEVQGELALLDERLRQAAEILRTFGDVARGAEQQEEQVPLLPLVESYIREFADQHRILCTEVLVTDGYPLDLRVRIRPMGLRQVLFNLILNAVQQIGIFNLRDSAGGNVVVDLAQEDRKDGPWVAIRVHDSGPGIHRADFDRVFELGYTTKKGGFGMGLDICRRIIGRVEIEGRRGEVNVTNSVLFAGTTFSVCLPVPKTQESIR